MYRHLELLHKLVLDDSFLGEDNAEYYGSEWGFGTATNIRSSFDIIVRMVSVSITYNRVRKVKGHALHIL